jgi:hypothetical protein
VDGLFAVEQIRPREPSTEELALASSVIGAVGAKFPGPPLLYARVDVLAGSDGAPVLLELELAEPSYFLSTDPASAARAAAAYETELTRPAR